MVKLDSDEGKLFAVIFTVWTVQDFGLQMMNLGVGEWLSGVLGLGQLETNYWSWGWWPKPSKYHMHMHFFDLLMPLEFCSYSPSFSSVLIKLSLNVSNPCHGPTSSLINLCTILLRLHCIKKTLLNMSPTF